MIEVIYKDEKQEPDSGENFPELPKNIRQIGIISDNYRIYMEDYVYTFLGKTASGERGENRGCLAVLTGETRWNKGITYVFIKGAVTVEDSENSADHLDLDEKIWKQIHQEIRTYFQGQEITGWFFGQKSLPMTPGETFYKIHQKYFGADKVLMLMELTEKEEAFFRYENNSLNRQMGYYLYYEKNLQMQNYMIEKNPEFCEEKSDEVTDEAVHTFRSIIQKKNKEKTSEAEDRTSVFSYAATGCLALALVLAGGRFYQNYHEIREKGQSEQIIQTEDNSTKNRTQQVASAEVTSVPATNTPVVTPETTAILTPEAVTTETPGNETEQTDPYKEEADVRKAQKRQREKQKETSASPTTKNTYVIRPGDTLYQISISNYGTMDKVAEICRENGITEDEVIYPGQIIVLP